MAKAKAAPPAIRRFTYRANPERKDDYAEQLANAEQRAGRKVTRVHTRRVRILGGSGVSPNRLMRPSTIGHALVRTFIFR